MVDSSSPKIFIAANTHQITSILLDLSHIYTENKQANTTLLTLMINPHHLK